MFPVVNCGIKRNSFISFLLMWLSVLLKYSVMAGQSVTLGWDSSSDPNVVGYNIYYGTVSQEYTNKVSAGNGTTVTITGLVEGETYYFAATTYDAFGQESGFSDEASYTVPVTINQPATNNFVAGQTVTFNMAAAGGGQLSFQWQFNSSNLASATNSVLTMNNITAARAGTYSVTVSDAAGLTTNITVNLAVYPTAAATLTQAVKAGDQYSFNVSGVPDFEYVVQASTNLVDWVSVETNVAPFAFTEAGAGQFTQKFYRTLATFNSTAATNGVANHSVAAPPPSATLTQAAFVAGQYTFNVSGAAGYEYIVLASTNLVDWVAVQTNLAPFTFTDPDASQFAQRFYRTLSVSAITASLTVGATTAATLSQAAYVNGQYVFNVSGVADYQYVVQASTNLVDWVSVQTNKAPFTFVDPNAGQFTQRFYRAF